LDGLRKRRKELTTEGTESTEKERGFVAEGKKRELTATPQGCAEAAGTRKEAKKRK
jgi:hypothetical protein